MPCQDTFDHHDVDNKGFLTKTELRESVRTLGHNPTEQELWRLLAQVWPLVLQKVASELHPKVRNHGEGPY